MMGSPGRAKVNGADSAASIALAGSWPVNRTSHQTVAVSIAFHTPKLARYLKIYREHFGLPPCGTTADGCLRIVNRRSPLGGAPTPAGTGRKPRSRTGRARRGRTGQWATTATRTLPHFYVRIL
jgi:hypothetical protein